VRRPATGWSTATIQCGPIALDTRAQRVTVAGLAVELTSFEYRLLELLMLHAGEVLSKSDLTDKLYAQDFERDSNVIEVLIARLRRKLDPQDQLKPIATLRGRGYQLSLPRANG
jgi:two-component system response regulator PhoP